MAFRLQLRPSTLDDADLVAALQAQRDPDDLSDPVLMQLRTLGLFNRPDDPVKVVFCP